MIKTFACSGNPRVLPGIKYILSCGLGLSPFVQEQPIPPREPNRKAPTSPRVIVGNSTGKSFARDAPLSTSVSNAGNLILPQSVKNNNQQQVMIKKLNANSNRSTPNTSSS